MRLDDINQVSPNSIGKYITIVLGVSIPLLFIAFILFNSFRTELTFLGVVLAVAASAYSAYHIRTNVLINIAHNKINHSFDFLDSLREIDFTKLQSRLDNDVENLTLSPDKFCEKVENNTELKRELKKLFVLYGHISIAIQKGYADEDTLYMALDTILPRTFDVFKPYIDTVRRDRNNDSKIHWQMEKLIIEWKRLKYLSTGKTIKTT